VRGKAELNAIAFVLFGLLWLYYPINTLYLETT